MRREAPCFVSQIPHEIHSKKGPVPLIEPDRTDHEPNAVAWASRDALRFDQNKKVRFDGKRG